MNFGEALEAVKEGKRIARKGWNGKGMYVYYVPDNSYKAITEVARKEFGDTVPYNPYFAIKNVNNTVSTWVPSVNDCLAEDWYVLVPKNTYRRKPTIVEALQWLGNLDEEMYKFLSNRNIKSYEEILSSGNYFEVVENGNGLRVRTKNGFVDVSMGDYIIKGENEYYPCNHETFERLYEKAYE